MAARKLVLLLLLSGSLFLTSIVLSRFTPDAGDVVSCDSLLDQYNSLYERNKKLHENVQQCSDVVVELRAEREEEGGAKSCGGVAKRELVNNVPHCDWVHVVMVVAGFGASRDVYPMLKSILFYHTRPLHLHLVTDSNATTILSRLFATWQLPRVNVTYYQLEAHKQSVVWVPNLHYSGIFGLMKLLLTEILPDSVDKAIVLDTDLTFAADITDLWSYFTVLRENKKVLGIIENQSDWYLGKLWTNHKPWPAFGRGFNTGVMLQDLKAMRALGWRELWERVAKETLPHFGSTALADQDIVNAVIKQQPDLHLPLPCVWNVQLGDHSLSEGCYEDTGEVKVLHWNSPLKLRVAHRHAHVFKNQYLTFQEYNGELLRKDLLLCPECVKCGQDKERGGRGESNSEVDVCATMREYSAMEYRTHLYFVDYTYQSLDGTDVTLTSQLSVDRLHMLEPLAKHWRGPISLAAYITDAEAVSLLQLLQTSPVLSVRRNLAVHVVYKSGPFYPVNYLRNVALKSVRTPFVFLSDIDFLPSYGSYEAIKSVLSSMEGPASKQALVIPAFESQHYKLNFPTSKESLLKKCQQHTLLAFRQQEWPQGHQPTDYERWFRSSMPYQVDWAVDYEPYVVVRSDVHQYDTRFLGFGWNKVSHIMKMDALGYVFTVAPAVFMIHLPHAPSVDIAKFRSNEGYRRCLMQLKEEFVQELNLMFGTDKYSKVQKHR